MDSGALMLAQIVESGALRIVVALLAFCVRVCGDADSANVISVTPFVFSVLG